MTDSLFVDFPATTPGQRVNRYARSCCRSWRDFEQGNDVNRCTRIIHTLAHSRVPFTIAKVVDLDGISTRAEVVRAVEVAIVAKWIYQLDDRNLYGPGPRLWLGKL